MVFRYQLDAEDLALQLSSGDDGANEESPYDVEAAMDVEKADTDDFDREASSSDPWVKPLSARNTAYRQGTQHTEEAFDVDGPDSEVEMTTVMTSNGHDFDNLIEEVMVFFCPYSFSEPA